MGIAASVTAHLVTNMADIDCIVIGAGVVGLAAARALAMSGREVLVLEQQASFGNETSARNSEVIHAGIYYPRDSLKARFCVAGKHLLYDYCDTHGVAYSRCGKLIVATDEQQVSELDNIAARAAANGVADLTTLSAGEVNELEPNISCHAALLSPSTGVLDSHGFMLSLVGDAEAHGAVVAYRAPVTGIDCTPGGNSIAVSVGGDEPMQISAREVVNASGHGACALGAMALAQQGAQIPSAALAKGNYFRLQGSAPVDRLIYPVPVKGGLGVHITIDLGGQVRFGPDVEWVDTLDYVVDPARADSFYSEVRKYWPALPDGALLPDYSGMRPKIRYGDELFTDFVLQGQAQHGIGGLVNLFGIESPGLTSSLAIADAVLSMLEAGGELV